MSELIEVVAWLATIVLAVVAVREAREARAAAASVAVETACIRDRAGITDDDVADWHRANHPECCSPDDERDSGR